VLDGWLGTARLVTVTGPGGVGKTRVALRAAARGRGKFADGVCLAELGGLHDPDLLPHTVATCLGLPGQEVGSQADAIVDYLRGPPAAAHPRLLRAPDRRVRKAGRTGAALRGPGDDPGH
jgi:predicted ATPase